MTSDDLRSLFDSKPAVECVDAWLADEERRAIERLITADSKHQIYQGEVQQIRRLRRRLQPDSLDVVEATA